MEATSIYRVGTDQGASICEFRFSCDRRCTRKKGATPFGLGAILSKCWCSVALVPGTLLWREDFARRVGASGARPRAERRSALRVGCGYAAL